LQGRVDQLAGGGADEVNGGGGGSQSELHARSGWERRFAKTADQAEVDVQDRRVAPMVEEMLTEGLYVVENMPIQHRRQIWMPPLRRRHADLLTTQKASMVQCQAVDGMAF